MVIKMKNRICKSVMVLTLCAGLLCGCAQNGNAVLSTTESTAENVTETAAEESQSKEQIKVVCTTFPQYDWVRNIIGDDTDTYDVSLLLDSGVDLHSYQPTAQDITEISSCDILIYVGGESDGWIEDALKESEKTDKKVINLVSVMGDNIKEEELVEGMEEHEEEEEEGAEEVEYDEHVWLSLKNAELFTKEIADVLSQKDAANKEIYQENSIAYIKQLSDLDKEYEKAVADSECNTLVFGDRFPFRYLVDDYQLSYYAAFLGCSAETEASFETVAFLANKIDELQLNSIFVIENSNEKIAETIINNTKEKNQSILVLNSMQSVTGKDVEAGETYLSVMKENLEVLKKALQ